MAITKYDPFFTDEFPAGLRLFQDAVNRLFTDSGSARPWAPPVDILETEDELELRADLPDVSLENIDIQLENGTLTLKGERKFINDEKTTGYHRVERAYGSFMRCFSVPETVDSDKVKADYRNGVLTVTLPKKEVAKPRSIKVEVGKA